MEEYVHLNKYTIKKNSKDNKINTNIILIKIYFNEYILQYYFIKKKST